MTSIEDDTQANNALQIKPSNQLEFGTQIQQDINLAQLMAKAKLILPRHFHNAPAECLGIIRISRLWNMDPYMVAQKTSVINNRLMYEGQLINAAINNSQAMAERLRFVFDGEGEARSCTAVGVLKGESEKREVTVGIPKQGQARNSPLWSGTAHDIDQQLTYKAARVWARRHAPELTLGIYAPEDDWSDSTTPEQKEVKQQNESLVQARLKKLETSPVIDNNAPDVTDEDFFEDAQEPQKSGAGRNITDNPEDSKEPEEETEIVIDCNRCGGKGLIVSEETDPETGEVTEAKNPCPNCAPKKRKPKQGNNDTEFDFN